MAGTTADARLAATNSLPHTVRHVCRITFHPALLPLPLTCAVLASALFSVPPLRDAVSLQPVIGVALNLPLAYVLLAPFSDCLDAITLLSAQQHLAGIAGLLAICTFWHLAFSSAERANWRASVGTTAILAAAILRHVLRRLPTFRVPWPGSAPWTPIRFASTFTRTPGPRTTRTRLSPARATGRGIRAGGYDVAYVTDHGIAPAADSRRGGVVLLSGIEADWNGEHVGVLGPAQVMRDYLTADLHVVDPRLRSTSAPNQTTLHS